VLAKPSGYAKLVSVDTGGDAKLDRIRRYFEAHVFPVLERAGLDPATVTLAWDFTTQSWEDVAGDVLAVVVAVAAIEFYAIQKFGRRSAGPSTPATIAAGTAPTAAHPIGFVDAPASDSIRGPAVVVSGWALAASGIRAVEGRIDGRAFAATLGLPRPGRTAGWGQSQSSAGSPRRECRRWAAPAAC
jgi:hypothetical protein